MVKGIDLFLLVFRASSKILMHLSNYRPMYNGTSVNERGLFIAVEIAILFGKHPSDSETFLTNKQNGLLEYTSDMPFATRSRTRPSRSGYSTINPDFEVYTEIYFEKRVKSPCV